MIDRETAEKIKDAADIVDVVSDYVHLIRRGANFVGLCPFHNERTPSFSVNRAKNFCYCFSCHKGGSPVNFIMEKEGISYHDALLQLARKYGIEVHERELSDEEKERQSEREAMFVANEWVASQLEHNLVKTEDGKNIGLSYLYGRGITAEAVAKFRLGYSFDKGTALLDKARQSGLDIEVLTKLGLIGHSREGRAYDRFRGRVMFPIMNASGKVVGFGGRDLKGGPAKYINSPESQIYKKSNELYGMFQAKAEISRQDRCYLVEGYLDVIGMWQAGLKNVVASSGTALTDGQIALIHRFTKRITVIYDGDAAGIKASLRGIDMLLAHGMEVKVLLLPDGHDPHSFANANTPETFREYIASNETDIIRFQTKVLLDEAGNDPQKRITAANSVVNSIASIPDALGRAVYIQECASVFGMDEKAIANAVEIVRRYRPSEPAGIRQEQQANTDNAGSGRQDQYGQREGGRQGTQNVKTSSRQSARRRKEENLLKECLRFGLIPFCVDEDEYGRRCELNVAEFVKADLAADGVEIQDPVFSKMLELIISMKPQMADAEGIHMEAVDRALAEERRMEIDRIASSAISMQGIAIAEKRLEENLLQKREAELAVFRKGFAQKKLASHEDDDIRRAVTEIISSRRKLSNIYTKDMKPQDIAKAKEAELETSVTRGILELKAEVIEAELADLMQDLQQKVNEKADLKTLQDIQRHIAATLTIRSRLAKELGERTVSPR